MGNALLCILVIFMVRLEATWSLDQRLVSAAVLICSLLMTKLLMKIRQE